MSKETNSSGLLPHKYNECYQCQRRQLGCHSIVRHILLFMKKGLQKLNPEKQSTKRLMIILPFFPTGKRPMPAPAAAKGGDVR